MFNEFDFPDFVSVEKICDPKWTNATYSVKKIQEEMAAVKLRIGTDLKTVEGFGDYAFEAMEAYKKSLDLGEAIRTTQEIADMAKRKAEQEKRQAPMSPPEADHIEMTVHKMTLTVEATMAQLSQLREFLEAKGIKYSMI